MAFKLVLKSATEESEAPTQPDFMTINGFDSKLKLT